MKHGFVRSVVLCLLLSIDAFGQTTPTPNIGLNLVSYASPQWDVPLNQNANILDLLLSGNQALKGLMFICQSSPASPASGFVRVYVNCGDGLLHTKNSAGVDAAIGNSGNGVTASGNLGNGNVVVGAGGTAVMDSNVPLGAIVTLTGGQVLVNKSIDAAQLTGTISTARFGFTPENQANKGAPSGYAPLDSSSLVPLANLPTIPFATTAAALSGTPALCSIGNAPTGILANGNATGCASIGGGSGSGLQPPVSGSGILTGASTTFATGVTTVAGALGYTPQNAATANSNNDLAGAAATAQSNAEAFAANGTNITSGTVAAARVAVLNQNTTGTAGSLAGTPTLCSTGQAPTGILANGNATGCAVIGGSLPSGSANLVVATPNGSSGTASLRALQATDVPTLNQNTTGTAGALAGTPSLCSTGMAPTGILANGNATGCAAIGGSSGGTVTNFIASGWLSWLTPSVATSTTTPTLSVTAATGQAANQFVATPNGTTGAVSLRSIVSADIPTLNQNTTGTAAALTATPTQCTSQVATGIAASGNANCATVATVLGFTPQNAAAANSNNDALGAAATAQTNAETFSANAANLTSGTIPAARMPAFSGDVSTSAGSTVTSLAATAVTPGSYTNLNATIDSKGRITAASNGSGGGSSPLTTKGDLFGFSTVAARIPVGADGTFLVADSTQALGVKYTALSGGAFTIGGSGALQLIGTTLDINPAVSPTLGAANTWSALNKFQSIGTTTNCVSAASPAACVGASAGAVVVAAAATTVVVNTSVVTANSEIVITPDASLGTRLSVTCNTTIPAYAVTARTPGTGFTLSVAAAPSGTPACFSYAVLN